MAAAAPKERDSIPAFQQLIQKLKRKADDMHALSSKTWGMASDRTSKIQRKETEAMMYFLELKQLNRTLTLLTEKVKHSTQDKNRALDDLNLFLQSLAYERTHLRKLIASCRAFRFKAPTNLLSMDEFLLQDPEAASRYEKKSHEMELALLRAELGKRKQLLGELKQLGEENQAIRKENTAKRRFLDGLGQQIRELYQDCHMVRDLLPPEFQGLSVQGEPVSVLPAPLARLYKAAISLMHIYTKPLKQLRVAAMTPSGISTSPSSTSNKQRRGGVLDSGEDDMRRSELEEGEEPEEGEMMEDVEEGSREQEKDDSRGGGGGGGGGGGEKEGKKRRIIILSMDIACHGEQLALSFAAEEEGEGGGGGGGGGGGETEISSSSSPSSSKKKDRVVVYSWLKTKSGALDSAILSGLFPELPKPSNSSGGDDSGRGEDAENSNPICAASSSSSSSPPSSVVAAYPGSKAYDWVQALCSSSSNRSSISTDDNNNDNKARGPTLVNLRGVLSRLCNRVRAHISLGKQIKMLIRWQLPPSMQQQETHNQNGPPPPMIRSKLIKFQAPITEADALGLFEKLRGSFAPLSREGIKMYAKGVVSANSGSVQVCFVVAIPVTYPSDKPRFVVGVLKGLGGSSSSSSSSRMMENVATNMLPDIVKKYSHKSALKALALSKAKPYRNFLTHIEAEVNHHCASANPASSSLKSQDGGGGGGGGGRRNDGEEKDMLLSHQLRTLMRCVDVCVATEGSSTRESTSTTGRVNFLRAVRGRDRRKPLIFNPVLRMFDQRAGREI
eukprot:jgi/Bigna1/147036/aug1.127_g21744